MSDKVTRTTRITTRASRRSDNNDVNVHRSASLLSATDESPSNNSFGKKRKLSSTQATGAGDGNRNKMNRSLEPDSDINNDTESNCSSQPDLGVSNGSLKRSTRLRKHSSKYSDYATFENNSNASSSHSNSKKQPKQPSGGSKTVKDDQDSSNLLTEAFFGSDLAKDSSSNEETIPEPPVVVKTSNVGRPRSRPSNTNIHSARSSRSNNSLSNNEEPTSSVVESVKDYEIIRVNTNTTSSAQSEPKSPITPIKIKISRNKDNSSTVSTISPSEPPSVPVEPVVNKQAANESPNESTSAVKSSSLKLNLGELVRNCKSKLGIQKDNEQVDKKESVVQVKTVEQTKEEEENGGGVASGDENVDNASVLAVVNAIASSERLPASPQKQPTVKSETRKNNELKRKKYLDEIKATYEQLFKEIKLNTGMNSIKKLLTI